LKSYERAGAEARIWGADIALHEHYEYDPDLTAAHLLGRDAAQICFEDTYRKIQQMLESEELMGALHRQMRKRSVGEEDNLLRCFKAGFLEVPAAKVTHAHHGTL
jgi:predicted nucleotidyltransferase